MQYPDNDKPPLFKSWSAWYRIVIGLLLLLIILFYLITKRFA